uniref:Uncharacterized protein n=1 Tax=Nelumbo nucifera TaxID=4432 RepID=A0A822XY66_NELNU|nr:TPA_asm: hypothetical protein HUJ06_026764 [Nelumbo nucifera]
MMDPSSLQFSSPIVIISIPNPSPVVPPSSPPPQDRSNTSDYDDTYEDDVHVVAHSISEVEQASMLAMSDLKSIADCLISSGYGKECVKIYKIIRKSIIDEGLYRLGIEKLTSSRIQKMDWDVLDLKIKTWLNTAKPSL